MHPTVNSGERPGPGPYRPARPNGLPGYDHAPPGTLCVTLLLRTAMADSTTQVFAEPGHIVSTAIPKMSLSSDDYHAHLEALLDESAG